MREEFLTWELLDKLGDSAENDEIYVIYEVMLSTCSDDH